jgi:hypothetical protein
VKYWESASDVVNLVNTVILMESRINIASETIGDFRLDLTADNEQYYILEYVKDKMISCQATSNKRSAIARYNTRMNEIKSLPYHPELAPNFRITKSFLVTEIQNRTDKYNYSNLYYRSLNGLKHLFSILVETKFADNYEIVRIIKDDLGIIDYHLYRKEDDHLIMSFKTRNRKSKISDSASEKYDIQIVGNRYEIDLSDVARKLGI